MDRIKKAEFMIDYLEKRINCENVMKFADATLESTLGEGKEASVKQLKVENIPVAFKVMEYDDSPEYKREGKGKRDNEWLQNMFKTFDFMTEANYTGWPYFPYIYGVLNCHNGTDSKVYIYYEVFDGSLLDLFNRIEHPSDWYDIAFQMIMINYYIENVNGYRYNDGTPQNHLYRKIKPYYKEYTFDTHKYTINHKYLITLWDFNYMEPITDKNKSQVVSNIDFLLKYINKNRDKIKIPPSDRIIKLLTEVSDNTNDTLNILDKYYGKVDRSAIDQPYGKQN